MKALKRFLIVILIAVMLVPSLALSTSACAPGQGYTTASYSVNDIKYQVALNIAAMANTQIESLVRIAQGQANPNIPLLIFQTNLISAIASAAIRALGFDAVCEYVTYEIGGQIVEIDPIIVIPLPGSGQNS